MSAPRGGPSAEKDAGRPHYPQRHPLMTPARNIVNQILDVAGTDVDTRQRINDECDQFVAWMLEEQIRAAGVTCSACVSSILQPVEQLSELPDGGQPIDFVVAPTEGIDRPAQSLLVIHENEGR